MHQRIESQFWMDRFRKVVWGLFAILFWVSGVQAQKGVIFTDADLGKEVLHSYKFSASSTSLKFTLKHRLGVVGPLEISSGKTGQFDGPFSCDQSFPFTIMPGEAKDLIINANYGKTIKESTELILLAAPVGDKDPKKTVTVKLTVSAEGRLMFWDEKSQRYSAALPTLVFEGVVDKLIEVAWNGSGSGGTCTLVKEGDARNAFKIVPNMPGAQPIASGATANVGKSAQSFFIKYAGPKGSQIDIGKLVISDPNGNSIAADLFGSKKGAAVASADPTKTGPGKVGVLTLNDPKANPNATQPAKTDIKHSTGIPGVQPPSSVYSTNYNNSNTSANPSGIPVPKEAAPKPKVVPVAGPNGSITDPVMAKAHLTSFFERRRGENLIDIGEVTFAKKEELFETSFRIKLDSLDKDKSMFIKPMWVSVLSGEDSFPVPMTNVVFLEDSMLMRVKLPSEVVSDMESTDSFAVKVGFMPEYLAGNEPVYLDDQKLNFTGSTIGRIYSESYFWLWFWIAVVLFIGLIFFLGFVWIRRPITTFRYLRESRYQRERYAGRNEDAHVEIEVVHLDLSRKDVDLVQLAFNIHSHDGLTGARDEATGKVRALDATVTAPVRGGLKRFFVWFYGLFRVSKEPRFRSVYYSLRIEPIKGAIPQNLRVKDESGLLLLGTSLTGNVLATDHQDFRFTARPFQYKIYFDPSEILDYSGTMKTVTIPFRVIEEPFEGYVMTRDFRLNLEVATKA